MSDIRKMTLDEKLHPEVIKLMTQFWEIHDKLIVDMDKLTYEEYIEKRKEMSNYIFKVFDLSGDLFLISLWGMEAKAIKLFGEQQLIDSLPI